jgi:hypothetical protein
MRAEEATFWVHWKISPRAGEPSFYEVCDDSGVVKKFHTHERAVSWCDDSGETYHDNTGGH